MAQCNTNNVETGRTFNLFLALARMISALLLSAADEYGSSSSSSLTLAAIPSAPLSASTRERCRFSCSSRSTPLASKVSWLSKPGQCSKSSEKTELDEGLTLRWSWPRQLPGEWLLGAVWTVGDEARTWSRVVMLLDEATESVALRSVEREDCAESEDCADSDGKLICCEARRRLWASELNRRGLDSAWR